MPKLQNVTDAEIKELCDRLQDLSADVHRVSDRLEKGYCDDIAEPVSAARGLMALTRGASQMALLILQRSHTQEQKRELESLLKQRQEQLKP